MNLKINVSRDMVEDGFIPIRMFPDVIKKKSVYENLFATDMESRPVRLEPELSGSVLLGFHIDIDVPIFSNISLMLFSEENGRVV